MQWPWIQVFKKFFIGVWLLYNVVLVSTAHQCESAVCIGICVFLLSHVQLFAAPWTVAHETPLSMRFHDDHTGVDCHFLLQGIFLTQELNPCLLHCRQTLDCWASGNALVLLFCSALFWLSFRSDKDKKSKGFYFQCIYLFLFTDFAEEGCK